MNEILNIILLLLIVGVGMWLINAFIPMAGPFKMLLNLIVFVCVILYILQVFGIIQPIFPEFQLVR